jgi:cell shape-determining protein MreC
MFLEGQNAVENSEQYDEKTARIAELEEKIKALENQEARVKSLEAENRQLSEDLLEMVRKFVIAPKAAKA